MSVLASGIAKIILGGSAVSLGAVGALSGLVFGENKEESLKAVVAKSSEEQDLNVEEELDSEELAESTEDPRSPEKEEESTVSEEEAVAQPVVEKIIPAKKPECRLHKLTSEYYGNFKQTTKEELEKEIPQSRKNDFQKIKTECEAKGNQDIFVSNKNSTGWRYYPEDQSRLKGKFDKYLATLNTQRR